MFDKMFEIANKKEITIAEAVIDWAKIDGGSPRDAVEDFRGYIEDCQELLQEWEKVIQ